MPGYPDKVMPGGSGSSEAPVASERKTVEAASDKKYSRQEMEKAAETLNKWMQSGGTHLKFTLHEKLGDYYVQIVDDESNEVIREIPSKKMMDMVANMQETLGILVDERR